MRIAFCGYDFFFESLEALVKQGHEVVAIFSEETDNIYNFNAEVTALSADLNLPIYYGRITDKNVQDLADKGCDILISAAYSYKIPSLEGTGIRGINLHPTALPEGRGPWPLPWLILKEKTATALTIHKLIDDMDAGDILMQKEIPLTADDCMETLCAKVKMVAPDLLCDVLNNFDALWKKATPQAEGTYWPMPTAEDYTLKPTQTVADILRTVRAFGAFETEVTLNNEVSYNVRAAKGWQEDHPYVCGDVIHISPQALVFAVRDGFVCLTQFKECDINDINEV